MTTRRTFLKGVALTGTDMMTGGSNMFKALTDVLSEKRAPVIKLPDYLTGLGVSIEKVEKEIKFTGTSTDKLSRNVSVSVTKGVDGMYSFTMRGGATIGKNDGEKAANCHKAVANNFTTMINKFIDLYETDQNRDIEVGGLESSVGHNREVNNISEENMIRLTAKLKIVPRIGGKKIVEVARTGNYFIRDAEKEISKHFADGKKRNELLLTLESKGIITVKRDGNGRPIKNGNYYVYTKNDGCELIFSTYPSGGKNITASNGLGSQKIIDVPGVGQKGIREDFVLVKK